MLLLRVFEAILFFAFWKIEGKESQRAFHSENDIHVPVPHRVPPSNDNKAHCEAHFDQVW